MKTSHALDLAIVAAGLASLVACAAPKTARHAPAAPAPTVLQIPEQTIYGDPPAVAPVVTASVVIYDHTPVTFVGAQVARKHVETDAEHIARLMTATPEMVDCAACVARKPFESMSGRVSRLGDR
jgi:hypothetical protein